MIEGVVNADYEARLTLIVEGPTGLHKEIEAVVDTGYDGLLTVPLVDVELLELRYVTRGEALLADDSKSRYPIHRATVYWDGRALDLDVDATGSTALIGMQLLRGYGLRIDVEEGGRVVLKRRRRWWWSRR